MKARATLASVLVLLALTAVLVGIAASPAFAANCGNGQGGALLLGCANNSATDITYLTSSNGFGLSVQATGAGGYGITANGVYGGLFGNGSYLGLRGTGGTYGVYGDASTGVYGVGPSSGVEGTSNGGNGVYGDVNTPGSSGVYGLNVGTGYGVAGRAAGGTGVLADSQNGTALSVQGKATFSRSGTVTVPHGNDLVTVTLAGVTAASMVLATSQQNKGVYVRAAVPGTGSFTIRLTGNAPTGGLRVAYFVLN
jgi:hypothetical protein